MTTQSSIVVLVILSDDVWSDQLAECGKLQPGMVSFKNLSAFKQTRHVFADKSFDQIVLYASSTDVLVQPTINSIVKLLKPGNTLRITFKGDADQGLEKRLKLAGLSDLEKTSDGVIKLTRKVFKAEQEIEIKEAPVKKNAFAAALQNPTKEKMDIEDLLRNDVIKEEEQGGSCATKPKACKDCSCGRKEEE